MDAVAFATPSAISKGMVCHRVARGVQNSGGDDSEGNGEEAKVAKGSGLSFIRKCRVYARLSELEDESLCEYNRLFEDQPRCPCF